MKGASGARGVDVSEAMKANGSVPVREGGPVIEARAVVVRPSAAVGAARWLLDVVRVMRPRQWVKNVYVLAPLIFSGHSFEPASQFAILVALTAFCLWSSSVYCLNDALDAEADRKHPRRRHRPIAAGRISRLEGWVISGMLMLGASLLSFILLPAAFLQVGLVYLGISLAYCLVLKHHFLVDVLAIAAGFVLRLHAGCAALEVRPTPWILVCGFSLALVLGFGKRRLELQGMSRPSDYRRVLMSYNRESLNVLLGISASVCLLSYMLYAVSPETIRLHNTVNLVYTVPFVAYGLFRFVAKALDGGNDGPVEVLMRDHAFAMNGLLWVGSLVIILYVR